MTQLDNPYAPPSASLEQSQSAAGSLVPPGDLDRALAGEIRLRTMDVVRDAWTLVRGMKLVTWLSMFLLMLPYTVLSLVIFGGAFAMMGGGFAPSMIPRP